MRCGVLAILAWIGAVTLALAEIPNVRPLPRPAVTAAPVVPPPDPVFRPKPRPAQIAVSGPTLPSPTGAETGEVDAGSLGIARSIRPLPRPSLSVASTPAPKKGIIATIFGGAKQEQKPIPSLPQIKKGSVCGDTAIRGETIARITGRVKGCGIEKPVRVSEVDGVRLSVAATLDCDTAQALRTWVTDGLKPAFGKTKVVELRVFAHYACRARNNQKGARISEHGRGKAIDIGGIVLASGQEVSVINDFRRATGVEMRRAHKSACGIFGTTLGPGSDRFHNDHMHFDTARYRGGPYCK